MINKAIIIGNLGHDPKISSTQSGILVANLSVATSERYKDKNGIQQENTEWHRIVAFGRLAEICEQYLKKGDKVYVSGRIQTRQWEDRDGNKRYTTEIIIRELQMLGGKPAASESIEVLAQAEDSFTSSNENSIFKEPIPF
jgi:single-strand DNA-binding protein